MAPPVNLMNGDAHSSIKVPECFKCPITREVMEDPVQTCDGQVYDRQAISEWLRHANSVSPITGLRLCSLDLHPVEPLQLAIDIYLSMNPLVVRRKLEKINLQGILKDLKAQLHGQRKHSRTLGEKEMRAWRRFILEAIRKGDAYVLRGLWGANAQGAINSIKEDPWRAMKSAAADGHADVLEVMAEMGFPLDMVGHNGMTLAHWAAHHGHAKVLEVLGRYGAPLETLDDSNRTPIMVALAQNQPSVFRVLERNGVQLPKIRNKYGHTLMHLAAIYGERDSVTELASCGVAADAPTDSGWHPAHDAAFLGRVDILEALCSCGAPLDVTEPASLAHFGVFSSNAEEVFQVLKKHGAPLDRGDKNRAVVDYAEFCTKNPTESRVSRQVPESRLVQFQKELLQITACADKTPAHLAAIIGNLGALKALHTLSVPLDCQTSFGHTPAHCAALMGHIDVLQGLHDLGVPLLIPDSAGWTPADYASHMGDNEVLSKLNSL